MSNTNNDNKTATDHVNEKYFYADQGDDSIPDHVNMADYSGKDAKSHLHLLGVIEMQKRIAEQRFVLKNIDINIKMHEPFEFGVNE